MSYRMPGYTIMLHCDPARLNPGETTCGGGIVFVASKDGGLLVGDERTGEMHHYDTLDDWEKTT